MAIPIRHTLTRGISGLTGLLVAISVLVTPAASAAESATVRLQKGIFAEETEGDLDAAIRWYRELLSEETTLRAIAAQAQYRYGECLRKKGQREQALAAFRTLIERYPGEPDLVARARRQLADLGAMPAGIRISKVLIQGRPAYEGVHEARLGSVSPDGRRFSFTDWRSTRGNWLRVRNLETGEIQDVTSPGSGFVWNSAWSPDGNRLAFGQSNALFIAHFRGPDRRLGIVPGDQAPRWYGPVYDWSPDGRQVLTGSTNAQLKMISIDDGTAKVAVTTLGPWFDGPDFLQGAARLSPDGRYVAYAYAPDPDDPFQRDIFVSDLTDGTEHVVVAHPAHDYAPTWTPDGRALIFASNRTGANGLWRVRMAEGRSQGQAELIHQSMGRIHPKGFTQDGRFFFDVMLGDHDVFTIDLDPQSGKPTSRPVRLSVPYEGWSTMPAWSPDGTRIAFIARPRFTREALDEYAPPVIGIHEVQTGHTRELTLPTDLKYAWNPSPRWSPGGQHVIVSAHDRADGRIGFRQISLESGRVSTLHLGSDPTEWLDGPSWTPDRTAIIYLSRTNGTNRVNRLVRRELESGKERVLWQGPAWAAHPEISPDGRQVALLCEEPSARWAGGGGQNILRIIPVDGGEASELFRFPVERPVRSNLAWSHDNRFVLFAEGRERGGAVLCRIRAQKGSDVEELGQEFGGHLGGRLSLHPDGRRLVAGGPGRGSELWAAEGLDVTPEPPVSLTP